MGLKRKFVQFSTPSVWRRGTKRSLIEKLCLTFLANQNLCLHCQSSLLCQQCCCSCFLPLPNCYALDSCQLYMCVCVCVCVYALSKQQFRLPGVATSIHSLTSPYSLPHSPLSFALLLFIWQLFALSTSHTHPAGLSCLLVPTCIWPKMLACQSREHKRLS